MLIDIRCKHCRRLLGRVSKNFYGVVVLYCRECKQTQEFSLAAVMKVATEAAPVVTNLSTNLPSCCWKFMEHSNGYDVHERLCTMDCDHEHHQTTDNNHTRTEPLTC